MKVSITKEFKEVVTVSQMPAVRRLIEEMKEDTLPIASYAKMVLDALGYSCSWEIFRPKAEIAFNSRLNNRFFDGSFHLDVWIEFLAFDPILGALDCGVHLSDIWDIPADYEERQRYAKHLKEHMYLSAYTQNRNTETENNNANK